MENDIAAAGIEACKAADLDNKADDLLIQLEEKFVEIALLKLKNQIIIKQENLHFSEYPLIQNIGIDMGYGSVLDLIDATLANHGS